MTENAAGRLPLFPIDDPKAADFNGWALRAVMASPVDPDLCDALFVRNWVKVVAATAAATGADEYSIPTGLLKVLANDELMARAYSDHELLASRGGFIAGDLVVSMWVMSLDPAGAPSLNRAIHIAVQKARLAGRWGDGKKIAGESRQIRAYWDYFRPVAHLWAADALIGLKYGSGAGWSYERNVIELIEWSEAIRAWLESFLPFRARSPLVGKDDLYRPPDHYRVQLRKLPTQQTELSPTMKAWLKTYRAATRKYFD